MAAAAVAVEFFYFFISLVEAGGILKLCPAATGGFLLEAGHHDCHYSTFLTATIVDDYCSA